MKIQSGLRKRKIQSIQKGKNPKRKKSPSRKKKRRAALALDRHVLVLLSRHESVEPRGVPRRFHVLRTQV